MKSSPTDTQPLLLTPTVEQALQQAIAHHRAGQLQDAERLYRAILDTQPKHPDANHNLGVIAISLNKIKAALTLFKIALEASPNRTQFWLSYVDALIKEKQFNNARNVLEQGKKRGLAGERVEALEAKLTTILLAQSSESSSIQTNFNQTRNPSQAEVNALSEHYQKGQLGLAENLAKSITQNYPDHEFSWKVLGAVFKQTERLQDSLIANKRAIEISPYDAEAHSNLGVTLQDLGRLEDAETSYKRAIAIKPDLAEAHNNVGNTLKALGRLEEAETSYKRAIAIMPDLAEAHNNLGLTLQELGRLEDAEASYKKAIAIKPALAEAHYNLGVTLQEFGRFAEAEETYVQAIRLKPDFIKARTNMLNCLYQMDKELLFCEELDFLIKEDITNSIVGSFTCRSALRYGEEKQNIFCNDPLNHFLLIDLKSRYNFEEIFVRKVRSILHENKRSIKRQTNLMNGYQTSGNLFDIGNMFTDEIQKIIRAEIENYRINFSDSQEGLIKKWPIEYSLYGWIISMKSGGELLPHMHETGWLTGSIYINIPLKTKIDGGNLVVALGKDSDAINSRQNSKKIIDVVTGSLALFPSSLMHHTIPFESEEERIVLAFDVIPKY